MGFYNKQVLNPALWLMAKQQFGFLYSKRDLNVPLRGIIYYLPY